MDANNKYGIPEPYCYEINVFDEHSSQAEIDESVWRIFLMVTDHIPNKILEGVATSEEYADELYYREVARQELDRLNGGTGEVVNAVPLDVLLSTLLGVE